RAAIDVCGAHSEHKGAIGPGVALERGLPETIGGLAGDPISERFGLLRTHGARLPRARKAIYPNSADKLTNTLRESRWEIDERVSGRRGKKTRRGTMTKCFDLGHLVCFPQVDSVLLECHVDSPTTSRVHGDSTTQGTRA